MLSWDRDATVDHRQLCVARYKRLVQHVSIRPKWVGVWWVKQVERRKKRTEFRNWATVASTCHRNLGLVKQKEVQWYLL